MNEKEARGILNVIAHKIADGIDNLMAARAKGYLEAIDKAKGLEESVTAFERLLKANPKLEIPVLLVLPIMDLLETLAKWEKEK